MTIKTPCLRILATVALLTGPLLLAGCDSDKVTKTTSTEQSTTAMPSPVSSSSSSTTTTQQSRP